MGESAGNQGGQAWDEPLVSMRDIANRFSVSYRCVQQWRAKGKLPPPDFVAGPRVMRWRQSAIDAFCVPKGNTRGPTFGSGP